MRIQKTHLSISDLSVIIGSLPLPAFSKDTYVFQGTTGFCFLVVIASSPQTSITDRHIRKMSGSVEYFSDWQDRTMKDLMSIIVANDDPKGEPLRGLAIFAKRLKCYQMKHSNAVVIGNVLVVHLDSVKDIDAEINRRTYTWTTANSASDLLGMKHTRTFLSPAIR